MPGRGRAPEPTAILKLRGSRRAKTARSKDEPQPEAGNLEHPDIFPDEAKAEWNRVVPELVRLGIATKIDRALLAGYCRAWSDYVKACDLVDKTGLTIARPDGSICKNPAFVVMNDSRLAMLRLAQEFGLSPSSRTRVNVKPPEKAESGAAAFFGKAAV